MKTLFLFFILSSSICFGQNNNSEVKKPLPPIDSYVKTVNNLTLEATLELARRATKTATLLGKKVTIAILDGTGATILMMRGDGVGPHNTEAARRKAYTALSTKTNTLILLRNAEVNADTKNLNTLPELLLLSGGVPIWFKGEIIGSIGVASGGSPENDNLIALSASIPELGISTTK